MKPKLMQSPQQLRELASWYRNYAERAGNPVIWECRLLTAQDLDAEASRLERLTSPADPSIKRQPLTTRPGQAPAR